MPSRKSHEVVTLGCSFLTYAFRLLTYIRQEKAIMQDLLSLGSESDGTRLSPQQAFELVADAQIGQIQVEDDAGEGIFDSSDRLEGEQVITWWNDIEKDKRYSRWPSSLQGVRKAYINAVITC